MSLMLRRCMSSVPNHIADFWNKRLSGDCFDNIYISKCRVVSVPEDKGVAVVELKVEKPLVNAAGLLHGGVIASLMDSISTLALFNSPVKKPGVSVNINLSYLNAAKLNDLLVVEGRVVKSGAKLAFLAAEIYSKSESDQTRRLIATCSHTKYIV